MTVTRVAISDLLGMLWSALVGVSSVLDLCPSPDDGVSWKVWWDRKSLVGKALTASVWVIALTVVGLIAWKALANTVDYFWI